jgi:hypothetical protein
MPSVKSPNSSMPQNERKSLAIGLSSPLVPRRQRKSPTREESA